MIYLDNAATTFIKPAPVVEALRRAVAEMNVNAGRGSYALARAAQARIDLCRERLMKLGHIRGGYHVYFSSGATASLNAILLALGCDGYTNIYLSPFEHNAVARPAKATGARLRLLPFDGFAYDRDAARAMFARQRPDYVFACMVSNVTGYRLPIAQIAEDAHACGARLIVDCAQALGSVELDLQALGADAYVFAGHKTLYGPFGIGGMFLSDGWRLPAALTGGTGTDSLNLDMPEAGRYEPGSMNITAIEGLNAALEWIAATGVGAIEARERQLMRDMRTRLSGAANVRLYAPDERDAGGILAFNVEGYRSDDAAAILDEDFDIAVRAGYQCAPFVHELIGTKAAGGVLRASVSYFNTEEDIAALAEALGTL